MPEHAFTRRERRVRTNPIHRIQRPAGERRRADLARRFALLVAIWNAAVKFFETVWTVASVDTFVTGYWEVIEKKKYCVGPTMNPVFHIVEAMGPQVFVIIEEREVIIKHSFWPQLAAGDGPVDDDTTVEYNVFPDAAPAATHDHGAQLARPDGIQRMTFYLLLLARLACFALITLAELAPVRRRRQVLSSQYALHPIPGAAQYEAVHTCKCGNPDTEMPLVAAALEPGLIRGPEAVRAARRAGFYHQM
ncbi:hypothetical protein DFH11DRAFT_1569981 [Phellopilus nigrolimitatus]|nr:hypothetical protein DFH11DRAFT_1569981 [Phellopilus nigrolimitatus]